jgi:hypothetical protein
MDQPDNAPVPSLEASRGIAFGVMPLRFALLLGLLGTLAISSASTRADPLDDWTLRLKGPVNPVEHLDHWDVTFGNGLFVAVGHFGGDGGSIFTSPDGVTWTPRHKTNIWEPYSFLGELRAVAFGDGRFVTGGWNDGYYTSTNGIDWQGGRLPGTDFFDFQFGLVDVCYGQGKFVAIDGNTRSNFLTSTDGLQWQRRQPVSVPFETAFTRIAFGDGRFVALSEALPISDPPSGPTRSFTSTDASTWTAATIGDGYPRLTGLTWGNGLFVAVGAKFGFVALATNGNPGVIFSSPDGLNWTRREFGRTNILGQVEFINGLFIATGTTVLVTSTNGIDWESRDSTNQLSRFAFGNGRLVGISGYAQFYWGKDLYQSAPLLSLEITRAHPPELSITGIVGQTCRIETDDDALGMWRPLAEFSLSSSPQVWTDAAGIRPSARLYRATWVP